MPEDQSIEIKVSHRGETGQWTVECPQYARMRVDRDSPLEVVETLLRIMHAFSRDVLHDE